MDLSELWGWGGESTALMTMAEEYDGNSVFVDNKGSAKLLVDNGAFEHCLDGGSGFRERLSDYARLEAPLAITTTANHKL